VEEAILTDEPGQSLDVGRFHTQAGDLRGLVVLVEVEP